MKPLGITGPSDSGKTTLVEQLTRRLSGPVATVKHLTCQPELDVEGKDTARHRAAGAKTTIGISDEHGWFATGDAASLTAALEKLAPDHEYVLVEGFHRADIPQVVLGDGDPGEECVAAADSAWDIDLDGVVRELEQTEPFVTLDSLVDRLSDAPGAEQGGALATFTGRVRRKEHPEDTPTRHLEFEKYERVAEERLATIRTELVDREGVIDVRMHHRTGLIEAGDDVVYVVVLARHRDQAFESVSRGIDRLKREVPLFKKEVTVEDEFWRHQSPDSD